MRFDTLIFFQRITKGAYNPNTGDYDEDTVTEVEKLASVTDSGAETMRLIYGEIRQGSKTIRLQNHYREPFDRIRIGDTIYSVDMSRKLRSKHSFIVSEVQ